ncbi:MAG: hypothetical protein KH216_12340, partial [Clostridiales bacterium]|nr:hypothetical protein [Clostridiales bacterium]
GEYGDEIWNWMLMYVTRAYLWGEVTVIQILQYNDTHGSIIKEKRECRDYPSPNTWMPWEVIT